MGTLIFKQKSSKELGITILAIPTQPYPERDITYTHVPGKSGDIVIDNGSYKNVEITYSMFYEYPEGTKLQQIQNNVAKWLSTNGVYARLEDSYDNSHFRMAIVSNSFELTDLQGEAVTFDVVFTCKPQRFLKVGDDLYNFDKDSSSTLSFVNDNIYGGDNKPYIEIYTSNEYDNNVENIVNLDIFNLDDDYNKTNYFNQSSRLLSIKIPANYQRISKFIIDFETEEIKAYDSSNNEIISFLEDSEIVSPNIFNPFISFGSDTKTMIEIKGPVKESKIKPRWWDL